MIKILSRYVRGQLNISHIKKKYKILVSQDNNNSGFVIDGELSWDILIETTSRPRALLLSKD